ncbi:proteasome subunit alpha type-7-like [Ruditapes philippinarum]|uniref:proteasome subunit alpha type-7-like n=1 Tax=Ruditapes philippinarum TaxID=129788 RepID=UPI00295C2673|nr:proteasome subunit alpha type-7-like [Ruditapes philippinarum]
MTARYDRAITVFSPDGHLFQVEYAQEAVKKGSTAVGVRGKDIVVLGVEKKAVAKLQEDRTVRKIALLDDHVALAFAGKNSFSLIEQKEVRVTIKEILLLRKITRYIAQLKQKYTQSNGRRPFGLSALLIGYDDGPHLYQTDPSGTYHEWKANAIGRSAKTVREFLEKHYTDEVAGDDKECIKLTLKSLLLQIRKHHQIFVIFQMIDSDEIDKYLAEIEKEKEEEAEKKKAKK